MYLSLARKYRPRHFGEVKGQEHIVLTLKNAIKANRINPAYLFYGPKGTGKTSIARILAKSLNCKEGPIEICCCKCSSCLEIDESRALDVIEIDGASNRGIDQIRELRERVSYSAIGGRFKVYIIDEVHMLTIEAFNALLKTLEEPPPFVIFVFATTEVQKVPKTISSRTQMFEFRKIEREVIEETLSLIAKKENFKIGKDVISFLASLSDGSLRDGEALLDQVILYKDNPSCDDVRKILGICKEETILTLIEMIRNKDISCVSFLKGLIDEGFSPEMIIRSLLNVLRGLIVSSVEKDLELAFLIKLGDAFVEAQERIRHLPDDSELLLEMAIIKLVNQSTRAQEHKSTEDREQRTENREQKIEDRGQEAEDRGQRAEEEAEGTEWREILEIIGRQKPLLKPPLQEAEAKIDGDKIILSFKTNTHRRIIEKEENRQAIEKILEKHLARKIRIFLEDEEQSIAEIPKERYNILEEGYIDEKKRYDVFKSACDIFRGIEVK